MSSRLLDRLIRIVLTQLAAHRPRPQLVPVPVRASYRPDPRHAAR